MSLFYNHLNTFKNHRLTEFSLINRNKNTWGNGGNRPACIRKGPALHANASDNTVKAGNLLFKATD